VSDKVVEKKTSLAEARRNQKGYKVTSRRGMIIIQAVNKTKEEEEK
jgi:hypothetical protein